MEELSPSPGMGITATVNGDLKTVKGEMGSAADILVNQKEVELKKRVNNGDQITFEPGRPGSDAEAEIKDVIPDQDICSYTIYLNGSENKVGTRVFQNGKLVNLDQKLIDGSEIEYTVPKTVREGLAQIMDLAPEDFKNQSLSYTFNGRKEEIITSKYLITAGGEKIDLDRPLADEMELEIKEKEESDFTIRELLQKKGNQEIDFYFNGSELTVPDQIWEVEVNGEKVELNYRIEDGDQIKAFSKTLTIAGVFDYINYGISENMEQKMQLILNGEPVNLSAKIKKGDKLKVRLNG